MAANSLLAPLGAANDCLLKTAVTAQTFSRFPSEPPETQATSLRTYLVEDSATIRENLIATLQELIGITSVGWAENSHDAIRWLTQPQAPWDLAIIDLFLRQGSGLDVLRACHARTPDRKMVVLTNYATVEMRVRCLDLGADAVFDKSTEIDTLIDYCQHLRDSTAP